MWLTDFAIPGIMLPPQIKKSREGGCRFCQNTNTSVWFDKSDLWAPLTSRLQRVAASRLTNHGRLQITHKSASPTGLFRAHAWVASIVNNKFRWVRGNGLNLQITISMLQICWHGPLEHNSENPEIIFKPRFLLLVTFCYFQSRFRGLEYCDCFITLYFCIDGECPFCILVANWRRKKWTSLFHVSSVGKSWNKQEREAADWVRKSEQKDRTSVLANVTRLLGCAPWQE